MGLDATSLLNSPQVAGVKVARRGWGKSNQTQTRGGPSSRASAGLLRRVAAGKAEGQHAAADASNTPHVELFGFLAATSDEVALINCEQTKLGNSALARPLARRARSDVASVELLEGNAISVPGVMVQFTDGQSWVFDVPLVPGSKRAAKKLVGAFRA